MNKRDFLARRLGNAGLLRLLERVGRRPCLLVLSYHRIGDPAASPFYGPIFSATQDDFRAQVALLRDRFRLIDLDDALTIAASGFRLDRPSALITFDDGYRDNVELALPVLTDLGAPAAFFIPSGFPESARLPWWDHVAYVLNRTRRPSLTLDLPEPLTIQLGQTDRTNAIAEVIGAFLRVDRADDPLLAEHLEQRAEVDVSADNPGQNLFVSWDQVRQLADAGMSIGSHSHSHPNLAKLSEPEQRVELVRTRQTLERELGREVATLAYPYGVADAVSDATRRLAGEAGYRLAFALSSLVNRPGTADPLLLGRILVGSADSLPLFRARMALASAFGSSPL
ncbi:MAG: polysaccharide deacetylase family protein [Isosphaeraceae bacterium]